MHNNEEKCAPQTRPRTSGCCYFFSRSFCLYFASDLLLLRSSIVNIVLTHAKTSENKIKGSASVRCVYRVPTQNFVGNVIVEYDVPVYAVCVSLHFRAAAAAAINNGNSLLEM